MVFPSLDKRQAILEHTVAVFDLNTFGGHWFETTTTTELFHSRYCILTYSSGLGVFIQRSTDNQPYTVCSVCPNVHRSL